MTKPKHTPGPWYTCLNAQNDQRQYVRALARDLAVCKIVTEPNEPAGIMEANARLIAAAPELLDALERLLKWHQYAREKGAFVMAGGDIYIDPEIAREAINKANGDV